MTSAFLLIGIVTSWGLVLALVWSLVRPDLRIWPPIRPFRQGRIALIWILTVAPFAAGLWVGVAEASPWPVLSPALRALGAVICLAGLVFLVWGIGYLSWYQTFGNAAYLVTSGPYRLTRNPQYLGDLLLVLGFVLLTGALPLLWIGVPLIAAMLLYPLTEEPWLADQFGDAYRTYMASTPRFLGWRNHRRN